MKCSKCGKEIANDSNFCEYCGEKMKQSVKLKVFWNYFAVMFTLLLFGVFVLLSVVKGTSGEYVDLGLPSGTLWKNVNEDNFCTYDEAVKQYGNMLPTKEQFEELKEKCYWSRTDNGYKVKGPNGNSIVLPAAGFRNGNVYSRGDSGRYWASTPNGPEDAWGLCFKWVGVDMLSRNRCYGLSVRLVQD